MAHCVVKFADDSLTCNIEQSVVENKWPRSRLSTHGELVEHAEEKQAHHFARGVHEDIDTATCQSDHPTVARVWPSLTPLTAAAPTIRLARTHPR
ncbi:hypothetical protein HPB52_024034 [Rhipicephalus sanguineus]|uniref:Uncharacterized protein n=1 Tax=Rhipicephalus sanguineus TaxID=34632 RepID=A0A9D4PZ54_RHISA|nr:hypothetical protein HPB52_024034 [Rhipicephalus sanguineus]